MHLIALPTVLLVFGSIPFWTDVKTSDVPVVHVDPAEAAEVLRRARSERGSIVVNASRGTLRIVDLPWQVDRLTRILREIDKPGCGCEWRPTRDETRRDRTEGDDTGPIELPILE
jgi:hypothetical protein